MYMYEHCVAYNLVIVFYYKCHYGVQKQAVSHPKSHFLIVAQNQYCIAASATQ